MLRRLALILETIKFPHSVFALPFALIALLVASGGRPSWRTLGLVVVCMVAARSAAMAFNRWTDLDFDAANPRTRGWPTVTGRVSPPFLLAFVAAAVLALLLAAWALNWVCLLLAPAALAVLLGYSYSKRFTALSHFWLGLALGLAPVGAHLAVHAHLWPLARLGGRWGMPVELFPILIGLAVLFWTAGFDLIYACQDCAADRTDPRLHSLPKSIGVAASLKLSTGLHVLALLLLAGAGLNAGLGGCYYLALLVVGGLLLYEHSIVRPDDLRRVNTAFFTLNGAVSLVLLAAVALET
jgi:4-hydroxybenzoate polyprenyltransferase